ncbi:APH domain-containing protein [Favolaschia claudopus]|uniref:APH domain-containing protein n=1 Tax=Favolaschia claudopus TaxID=2862362 RepID=A0AAW0E358_9AGAR
MAMLHAEDMAFATRHILSDSDISALFANRLGLLPTKITTPTSQGSFHKVYFVSLEQKDGLPWSGKEMVLRVARRTIAKTKTENEIAILRLLRAARIPVPEVVFFCADSDNPLKYEYNCLDRIDHPSLSDTWSSLTEAQLDSILDQIVDIFVQMWTVSVPRDHGSLCLDGTNGPVIEETMWTLPDIERYFHAPPYNLSSETFSTLNPITNFGSWPDYICGFLTKYTHIITIHPSVTWLRELLPALQQVTSILGSSSSAPKWVERLRKAPELRGRLFHRDFHFGNILADEKGNIKAVIDWEFAGIGPSFASRASPIRNVVGFLRCLPTSSRPSSTQRMIDTWEAEFSTRLAIRSPEIAAKWAQESDRGSVLGVEGEALSDLREYLRSCLEIGVRGEEVWGSAKMKTAQTTYKDVVVHSLKTLGCS